MYNITNISKSYRENEVKPTCCRQNTVPASTVSGSYLMQPTCSRQNTVHASTVSGSYLMQPTCSNQNAHKHLSGADLLYSLSVADSKELSSSRQHKNICRRQIISVPNGINAYICSRQNAALSVGVRCRRPNT